MHRFLPYLCSWIAFIYLWNILLVYPFSSNPCNFDFLNKNVGSGKHLLASAFWANCLPTLETLQEVAVSLKVWKVGIFIFSLYFWPSSPITLLPWFMLVLLIVVEGDSSDYLPPRKWISLGKSHLASHKTCNNQDSVLTAIPSFRI